jgi:hypothetical protein
MAASTYTLTNSEMCSFTVPLLAAEAVGLLGADFLSGTSAVQDTRLAFTTDAASCTIRCSRELALVLAARFQRRLPRGIIARPEGAACVEAAATTFAALRRLDDARRFSGRQSPASTTL